jgi:hypothetical protein
MKISKILTNRSFNNGKDYGIVNEWEDIFSELLNAPLYYDNWKKRDKTIFWKLPWLASFFQTNVPTFTFVMLPIASPHGNNKKNIIPCMIDFFCRSNNELQQFYKRYAKNPLVLISSKEAYDYLVSVNCPLNIKHLALSISDKYRIDDKTTFEKRYDVVMLGRQNKVLQEFLNEYSENHKDLTYVYGKKEGRNFRYYDQGGADLGCMSSRDEYMNLMKQSRIGLYATPAMDGGRTDTNGFNQVTPRFLEYIVSGCHVLARYPKNSDTDFYELDRMSTRIETYEQFETAMDELRNKEVDVPRYSQYLENHYTSVRVQTLLKYLEEV